MAGNGESDADDRVDVAAARVRQTLHYRRDTDAGGQRDQRDAVVVFVPMRAQRTTDKHEEHGAEQFAKQIPIEPSLQELGKTDRLSRCRSHFGRKLLGRSPISDSDALLRCDVDDIIVVVIK